MEIKKLSFFILPIILVLIIIALSIYSIKQEYKEIRGKVIDYDPTTGVMKIDNTEVIVRGRMYFENGTPLYTRTEYFEKLIEGKEVRVVCKVTDEGECLAEEIDTNAYKIIR